MKYINDAQYLQPTPILDSDHPVLTRFAQEVWAEQPADERDFLQRAHQRLSALLVPVYTLKEHQKASTTFIKGRGSCSQRMAVLEAVARSAGIGTRSQALWIAGQFWTPRFQHLHCVLPQKVLLAWPEFLLNTRWTDFAELYSPLTQLASHAENGFSNATGETLFEAVNRTAIDWYGQTRCSTTGASCDLSKFVVANDGIFPSRDDVFVHYGLFLHRPEGCIFEVIFGGRKAS